MLEVARLMRLAFPEKPVMYVAFAGEEDSLSGSYSLAKLVRAAGWRIHVVVNLDMVGWVDPQRPDTVTIEFDQDHATAENDAAAKIYGLKMAQMAVDYSTLKVDHTDIWSSDYLPFEMFEVPCIGIYDGGVCAPFYHSRDDVPAVVSEARLVQVARTLLAFAADFVPT